MNFGYTNTFQLIDKGNIELLGPSGFSFNVVKSAKSTTEFQSGVITNYTLTLVIGTLVFLSCLSFVKLGIVNIASCSGLLLC